MANLDHKLCRQIPETAVSADERRTLESRYIHCDESRIQVLGEPDQKGTTQNWMWVYLTDEFSGSPQMVLFDYERTRAGYHPVNFFLGTGFVGI